MLDARWKCRTRTTLDTKMMDADPEKCDVAPGTDRPTLEPLE
jgi:hypothetical protein